MFRAVNLHEISNGAGVTVSLIDRCSILYRRSERELVVPRECVNDLDSGTANIIYLNSALRWRDDQPVEDTEREIIARDIVEAYRAVGIDTEVVS